MAKKKQPPSIQPCAQNATVVCVTDQYECERLIRAGRTIALEAQTPLTVIHIARPGSLAAGADALEYLFKVSKENGAEMLVYYSEDPLGAIAAHLSESHALQVVTGMPESENSILPRLWQNNRQLRFFSVSRDNEILEASAGALHGQQVP